MASSDRLLHSPELRAALYYSADGRCQQCGVNLEDGWHADHIIPWVVSRRTNVFEMDALCPPCNLKKGASMNDMPGFQINEEAFRPGQRLAYQTIVDRIRRGEKYTAIVLPTRYGKTDVMRVSGLRLWRDGLVSNAMIMAPDRILRDQSMNPEKLHQCLDRYGIPRIFLQPYTVEDAPKLPWLKDRNFMAITTQMATAHINVLTQWVDSAIRTKGVPPVVFVDEAHTSSDGNTWGQTMERLEKSGAFIVLLTATPYRSDSRPIPGFDLIPVKTTPVTISKPSANAPLNVDVYEGNRFYYRLQAHHITTFRQAWDEETPSPLCSIYRRTFEINLEELEPDTCTGELFTGAEPVKLSDLNERDTRRVLTWDLKNSRIIHDACRILADEVARRRNDLKGRETAAIVFVGNDSPHDDGANQHAQDVKISLRELAPNLHCVIATSSDSADAIATIERFANGEADVLIVKQMGGRGLDIARLKVCLDLSNIRTAAAFVQRITRICTPLNQGGSDDEMIQTATYIAPNDSLGAALFQRFIIDEGGEASTSDLYYRETVTPTEGERQPEKVYIAEGTDLPEIIEDSQQEKARGVMIPPAERFFALVPEAMRVLTMPRLANALEEMGIPDQGGGDVPMITEEPSPNIQNITEEFKEQRRELEDVANKLTNKKFRDAMGRPYRRGDKMDGDIYVRITKDIWSDHKRQAGVSPSLPIRDFTDMEKMKTMRRNMTVELRNG